MSQLLIQDIPQRTVTFDLPESGGLCLEGILNGELDKPLVVIMHGLGGSARNLMPFTASQALYANGFSTLRLNMYGYGERKRKLRDCLIRTHVEDFETVVKALRNGDLDDVKVTRLYAAGHSLGGITIVMSKVRLDGAVLWDPSHGNWWAGQDDSKDPLVKYLDGSRIDYNGKGSVWSEAMAKEMDSLGDTSSLAAGKGYPLKVITAGDGVLVKEGKAYAAAADELKAYYNIAGATHSFDDSASVLLELLDETTAWFKEIDGNNSL